MLGKTAGQCLFRVSHLTPSCTVLHFVQHTCMCTYVGEFCICRVVLAFQEMRKTNIKLYCIYLAYVSVCFEAVIWKMATTFPTAFLATAVLAYVHVRTSTAVCTLVLCTFPIIDVTTLTLCCFANSNSCYIRIAMRL